MSGDAIRNPKRGKAHRRLGRWEVAVCKDTRKGLEFFKTLTEVVPVDQCDPHDLCRVCWPGRAR